MVNLLKKSFGTSPESITYKDPVSAETGSLYVIGKDYSNFSIDFWSWPMARSMEALNFLL